MVLVYQCLNLPGSEPQGSEGSPRVACGNDVLPKRGNRHGGQFEVPKSKWDSNNGEAKQQPRDQVGDGHPQSDQDKPKDVTDSGRSASSGSPDDGPAKWPKDVGRKAERWDTKRNRDDKEAHNDPRHCEGEKEPNPGEDQPEQIQDDTHRPSLS